MKTTNDNNRTFWDEIADHIIDWMWDNEGDTLYAADMRGECDMGENMVGAWKIYTSDACDFIAKYWDEASATFDYFKNELDMAINPFESPTAYTFYMLDYGIGEIMSNCPFFDDNWNNEIALVPGVIKHITNQLNDAKNATFVYC